MAREAAGSACFDSGIRLQTRSRISSDSCWGRRKLSRWVICRTWGVKDDPVALAVLSIVSVRRVAEGILWVFDQAFGATAHGMPGKRPIETGKNSIVVFGQGQEVGVSDLRRPSEQFDFE